MYPNRMKSIIMFNNFLKKKIMKKKSKFVCPSPTPADYLGRGAEREKRLAGCLSMAVVQLIDLGELERSEDYGRLREVALLKRDHKSLDGDSNLIGRIAVLFLKRHPEAVTPDDIPADALAVCRAALLLLECGGFDERGLRFCAGPEERLRNAALGLEPYDFDRILTDAYVAILNKSIQ